MALGADTWDGAPEIWGGPLTSEPTPLPPIVGPDRPYHSAWWKITPDTDCVATIDTSQSLATDPSWSTDTYLIVYSGMTFETSTFVAANDDGGGNASSRLVTPLSAGVTYHIRAGSFAPDGNDIDTLVLNVSLAVMSEWIQAPNETRSLRAAIGQQAIDGIDDQEVAVSAPSAGDFSTAVNAAWASPGHVTSFTPPGLSDLTVGTGPGIDANGSFTDRPNTWTYRVGSGVGATARVVTLRLAMPDTLFFPSNMTPYLPADAGDDAVGSIELESPNGTRLSATLLYEVDEFSYDTSASGAFDDAVGAWTYRMTTPVGNVDVPGPGHYNSQIAQGSLDVLGHLDAADDAVPVSLRTIWGSVTVRDPAFRNNVGNVRIGAGHWYPHTESLIRPPRFRYLKPFTVAAPQPSVFTAPLRAPALRQFQRSRI